MAFCLSLFHYPCASSPDQLRQEEPPAHWGHLSLLFTGLTKAAHVFPGCSVTCFSPPREHTHICRARVPGHLKPWGRLRKRSSLYWLISSACCHERAGTVLSTCFQPGRQAVNLENRVELFQYNILLCLFWCGDADVTNHARSQWHRECVGKAGVWWRWFCCWRSQKMERNHMGCAVLCPVRVSDGI